MKPKLLSFAAVLFLLCFNSFNATALAPGGNIMGRVLDPATKEPVAFASVILDCQGSQQIFTANENGYYYASNVPACVYKVIASYQSKTFIRTDIKVSNGETMELDLQLAMSDAVNNLGPVVVTSDARPRKPLIDPLNPTDVTVLAIDIKDMPVLNIGGLTEQQAHIVTVNNEYHVSGAREGSLVFYIDDCRVMGEPVIPLTGLDLYRVYTGFLPARYGDTTGGAIVMETKNYFSNEH